MTLDAESVIGEAARFLVGVRRLGFRAESLPMALRPADTAEAYAIQDRVAELLRWPVVGWKIGCTSRAAQDYMDIRTPFAGRVFSTSLLDSPAILHEADYLERGIEAEFALVLGRDLPPMDGVYDAGTVAPAVAAVAPAIEIIEPRYHDWLRVDALSVIADNGGHGALIRGEPRSGWPLADLNVHPARLTIDGRETGAGTGAEVLGHPLNALAWLANQRIACGDVLRAGQIVTTGTCTGYVQAPPRARVVADFGSLGTVEAEFV